MSRPRKRKHAPAQKQKLAETEAQISAPDFWNQPEKSQKVMQARKRLEEAIGKAAGIPAEKMDAAKAAAPYVHARLAHIERKERRSFKSACPP